MGSHGRSELKSYRFRVKRDHKGVAVINRWGANVIGSENTFVYWLLRAGAAIAALFLSQMVALIVATPLLFVLFKLGELLGFDTEWLNDVLGFVFFIVWMLLLCLGFLYASKLIRRSQKVLVTSDRIQVGRKSYPLPQGTYFRYISQGIPGLYKMYAVQPGGGAYFAHGLTHPEAEELLRIVSRAGIMRDEERSRFSIYAKDQLIYVNSQKTNLSFVLEHSNLLWESLRCRMLNRKQVELTKSELKELYSRKLQAF